jgi:hypothetical protein
MNAQEAEVQAFEDECFAASRKAAEAERLAKEKAAADGSEAA